MKFQLHNLEANDASGPVMGATGANAFNNLDWNANISDAYAIEENTALLDGVDGITVTMDDFRLFDFDLRGTASVDQRDRRTYINGTARIYQNDVLKLELINCRIGLNVSYPLGIGEGLETTGGGWGEINHANSDDTWEAEFDEHGTGQVDFVFNSFSSVVNNPFYDAVISIVPNNYRQKIVGWDIPQGGGVFNYLAEYYASFNFTSAAKPVSKENELNATAGNVMLRLIETNPGGANPVGIDAISPDRFWEFGTTVSSFNANITFDLTGVGGISNINNIRILHRDDENSTWTILDPGDYTINGSQILVSGINSFSQFAIGSTSGNSLPVELTSFTANQSENKIILNWQTATELNNYGFEIERQILNQVQNDRNEWKKIGFIEGNGNSSSPKEYSFIDEDVSTANYLYRLKQIDFDGNFEFSNIIEVDFNNLPKDYKLLQNYPNPFNPSTSIEFSVPSNEYVSLKIYDVLGNEVADLLNEQKEAGNYKLNFNAGNLTSGIYIYKLSAGNFTSTKKLMLLK